ncbi:MAG: PilZ domain-containing protein [Deltaproteobacteria bacterium]|nr:PilZ domain-containing protein [Deltaproteobacteria bacterium]
MSTTENRVQKRVQCRLDVEFQAGEEWRPGTTRNLSLGGAFVEAPVKPLLGTQIHLRFRVPTQKELVEIGGRVRWLDDSGFGVQFDGLRARDVWAMGKYLNSFE